jgi:hypothetical protein
MNTKTKQLIGFAFLTVVAIVLLRDAAVAQDANLTRVNVVVTEPSRDRMVRSLEKENFKVWEDDVAQEIVSMTPGTADGEYVLAYKSTNSAKDGKWRNLRANIVLPKGLEGTVVTLHVRFQAGYYAPAPGN